MWSSVASVFIYKHTPNTLSLDILRKKKIKNLQNSASAWKQKNWMKPTNPNADTFVEGERQYLSHFLPDIVAGHHDTTYWFDSDTIARHSCDTPLLDTLLWHSDLTLLWGTLIWHSSGTPLLDTFCTTLLFDTFVSGHSGLTHFLDTFVGQSYLTRVLGTLVVTLFLDTLLGHSYLTLFWNTLTCHFLYDTLTRHACRTFWLDKFSWHSCEAIPFWHFCRTLWLDTSVGHSDLTLL